MAEDQKDKDRIKKALDAMIFLPHLKDRQAQSVLAALLPNEKDSRSIGRPWDRGDLFRRLKTFKSSTWFAKPDAISAEECARRGWENSDVDVITCESCKAVVSCPIPMQLLPDEAQKAGEQYAKQISDAHAVTCPWRSAVCSISLLLFPQLPKSAVGLDYADRTASLLQLSCLPPLASSAIDILLAGTLGPLIAQLIEQGPEAFAAAEKASSFSRTAATFDKSQLVSKPATCDQEAFNRRVRALTLCGWALETLSGASTPPLEELNTAKSDKNRAQKCRVGPECAMLSCALCGAKAGLWTNFPDCQPQENPMSRAVSAAIPIPAAAGARKQQRASYRSAGSSPPASGKLYQQVSVNLSTTIAGGSLEEGDGFGAMPAKPFGASSTAPPAFGFGSGAAITSAAPSEKPSKSDKNDADVDELVPVFGFAALRAAEPGTMSSSALLQQVTKRRREDDAFWDAALGLDKEKRAKTAAGDNTGGSTGKSVEKSANVATAPLPMPPQSTLQQYRSMQSTELDPLSLHRRFCPWVHVARTAGGAEHAGHAALCGWQWCAKQLGPDQALREGAGGANEVSDSDNGGDRDGCNGSWDPAALLRSALAKVEVKKS